MLIDFFMEVRRARVPASLREYLDLIDALQHRLAFADLEEFYYLARLCLVKDERHYDKFDRAFDAYFKGIENLDDLMQQLIPEDWLRKEFEKQLSEEEKAKIDSLGGLEELIKAFKDRLENQKERHQGGNRQIGTGGTSPFGAHGYNPEGFRIGQEKVAMGVRSRSGRNGASGIWMTASPWVSATSRLPCAGCVNSLDRARRNSSIWTTRFVPLRGMPATST